ncbi:hypothetical protein V1282_000196 [Nitrobacteraceae bacterium AZCC 2146]
MKFIGAAALAGNRSYSQQVSRAPKCRPWIVFKKTPRRAYSRDPALGLGFAHAKSDFVLLSITLKFAFLWAKQSFKELRARQQRDSPDVEHRYQVPIVGCVRKVRLGAAIPDTCGQPQKGGHAPPREQRFFSNS